MQSAESRATFEARLLLRVGLLLWLLAGASSVWEVLALQPPDSPLHIGVLAGPVAQLRAHAFALGTCAVVSSAVWGKLYHAGQGRWVALLLVAGALLQLAALSYAASRGMLAVQLLDPRADARLTLYVRALGHLLSMAGLAALLWRASRSRTDYGVSSPRS